MKPASLAARTAGSAALGLTLVAVLVGVVALRGSDPRTYLGVAAGVFAGLVSLVLELAMVERAERTFHAQGAQVTFMSFVMRLAVVAPFTLLFLRRGSSVDHEAFALSYCSTFLVYLCWLTWKTYHAPVQYRPKAEPVRGRKAQAPTERRRLASVGGSFR